MFADRGERALAVDLDPQANLTSMFLDEDRLEELWPAGEHANTIFGAMRPIIRGIGDVLTPHVEPVMSDRMSHAGGYLGLIVGDLALSTFEDKLSAAWPQCHNGDEAAFRAMSAFHRAIRQAAASCRATSVLIDIGPNLGAINRAALLASDLVVIPLGPDLFSLQGLRNLGPTLHAWRKSWSDMKGKSPDPGLDLPAGRIEPMGYVVMQHGMRENRPPKAYQRWIDRFPLAYRESVLNVAADDVPPASADPHCLAQLKHYRSLMPMAMEARKPVFYLKPADGAIGAHVEAVRHAYLDFFALAKTLAVRSGSTLS
jgi:cellulose biosynthesis protein BcsQ